MKTSPINFPFIKSAKADTLFILLPPFLILGILFLLPSGWLYTDYLPEWGWLFLIVGVDVAHVYSTLFRSYWNPQAFGKYKNSMLFIPVIALAAGILLYSTGRMNFWRCLAYLAVFHFIRQQYGFLRIYSRNEKHKTPKRKLEGMIIYAASIYPIIFWHLSDNRNFHWSMDGDFLSIPQLEWLSKISLWLYAATILVWITLMIVELKDSKFNLPKHALIAGTYLSWYFGIVYFNGDFAFTALNVISHGIPYMALVWFSRPKSEEKSSSVVSFFIQPKSIVVFVFVLITFAYLEEGIWDSMHWRDKPGLFHWLYFLPKIESPELLAFLVPLLALPQMTHYILDGFIWRVSKKEVQEELGMGRNSE